MSKPKKKRVVHSPDYRQAVLDQVHTYAREHNTTKVTAMRALKIPEHEYYRFQAMAKATTQTDRQQVAGSVEEFPLALIPSRTQTVSKPKPIVKRDEDKDLAAQLLEVAVRLLKR